MNGEMSSSICAVVMDVFAEKGLSEEAEDVFYKERNLAGWKKDVLECNFIRPSPMIFHPLKERNNLVIKFGFAIRFGS